MLLAAACVRAQGPDDLQAWCQALAARVRGVAATQCAGSALERGEGRSVKGVPLWRRDIVPSDGPAQLRVMVLGGIHGDEAASVALVFDWMERAAAARHERVHWRMVPLVNPDGLLRRPATRVNARGVDLNRNFATDDWATDAQTYWVRRTGRDARRFPGRQALSEPETQWVHAQIEQFRPDLIVSVHAPYGVLDFDGPPPAPSKLGSLILDQVGIYPGSLGNYGGVKKGVPVVTIELRNALSLPGQETALMWADLQEWIDKRLLRVASADGKPRAGSGSR
jgi:murein peptide amidase A